jgi:DNA primase
MDIDRDFVIDQLERVCSSTKLERNDILIVCPFHADNSPSCSVHISGHKMPIGTYHCWSCGAKGPWGRLASQLGLEAGDGYVPENPFGAKRRAIQQRIEDDEVLGREAFFNHLPRGSQPWEHGSFRGLPEEYLVKLDARRWYDDYNECQRIVFPVTNRNGVIIGSVARRLDKETFKPWYNSPGPWARKALFPIEIMPRPLPTVVLVEGPYDALRLNYLGIPALSILGTQNWSPLKISTLNSRAVEKVILCMDGDDAGRKATNQIYADIEGQFIRKRFMLPIDEENPIDPGNMDDEKVEALREYGGF